LQSTTTPGGPTGWRRLLGRTGSEARALVPGIAASLVAAIAASLWASLVGPLLESLIRSSDVSWGPFLLGREDLIWRVPLAVVLLAVVKAVASFLHSGLMGRVGQRVLGGLRRDLYSRLLDLPPRWYEVRHSGELLSRFTSDVAQVEFAAAGALSSLVKDVLQVLGLLAVCLSIDARLFLVIFIVLPGTIVPVSRFARSAKKAAGRSQASLGALSMMASEQLQGLPVVQAMRAEGAALTRFDAEQGRYLAAMKRSLFVRGAFSPTTEFLGILGVAAAVTLGSQAVLAEPALAGKLVSFLAAALLLYQPVKSISNTVSELSRASAALARLDEVLDALPDGDGGRELAPLKDALVLDGLRLTYPDGREALKGVSFTVKAGSMVALVGPSGSGKSSVMATLLEFATPSHGQLRWDGVPLATVSRRARRAQLGWVSQEPVMLSGSIRQNLLLGKAEATEAELWTALEQAHLAHVVKGFAGGLEEEVGERGSRLSGGQRQRLAIARAFLRQPSVLLLDEPTSALDAATEEEVQAGLEALMRGRTTLVIAHRLSTVKRAARIVVVEAGVVVEEGTHDELLGKHGVYARLVAAARGDALG
jgi:subfamily B ATP-binding cassette protein MsbA